MLHKMVKHHATSLLKKGCGFSMQADTSFIPEITRNFLVTHNAE